MSSTCSSNGSSRASSPVSSKGGLYIPIHRRTSSLSSNSDSASSEPTSSAATRKFYTPKELLQLAQSPLSKQLVQVMQEPVSGLIELAINRHRQRTRRGRAKADANETPVPLISPPPPDRRRSGRNSGSKNKTKMADVSSWRAEVPVGRG